MQTPPGAWGTMIGSDSFEFTMLKDLKRLVLSTFSAEDALKEKMPRTLQNVIFNAAGESIDKPCKDCGALCYFQ